MCGIAGIFSISHAGPDSGAVTRDMLARLRHRGPDELAYMRDGGFAMGTARLSIIDLESGQQPLADAEGRFWICFNGELYNYKELRAELREQGASFRTRSDTEVVLQAWIHWGSGCLTRFNGAFAFAIFDSHRRSLFFARDRYGKRPLFYYHKNGVFVFASEMKALLACEAVRFELDPLQLASILGIWTPLPRQSGFKDITQLGMGEYMLFKDGELSTHCYESLSFAAPVRIDGENQAIDAVREALESSVALRLRSDVEVGVYLSGGLDSSIIAHLVTQQTRNTVHTFSIGFEDKQFDESADQRELTAYLGTAHTALRVSHRDIVDNFPAAIFHAEVPAFRTAFVPMFLLSRMVREHGIKVVLSGEGADEVFLGYNIFKETMLREAWHGLSSEQRRQKLSRMYPYLKHFGEEHRTHLLGLYQQFAEEKLPGLFSHEIRFQNGRFANRLLKEKSDPFAALVSLHQAEPGYAALSAVQKAQWLEFKTLLSGYLLSTQGERMSLAHSVENRCPFLDPNVVALSSAVNLKFDDGATEKYLLRKAFEQNLPSGIINKHKHPYRAPDSAAFVDCQPDYLDLLLSDDELNKQDIIDPRFARALTNKIYSRAPEEISTRENQAFIFLLSIAFLQRYFVNKTDIPWSRTPTAEDVVCVNEKCGVA